MHYKKTILVFYVINGQGVILIMIIACVTLDTYKPLNITLIIVVKAFPPLVFPCLTRTLAYQRRNAQAQKRSAYVDPMPIPLATPVLFASLRAFLSEFEYVSIAFFSPTNEYTVRTWEIT